MNNANPYSDLLLDYLDNILSLEEKLKVEEMLQNDKALQTELDNMMATKSAIQYYGIKQQVQQVRKNIMENKIADQPITKPQSIVKSITKWSMRIAASLLVLMLGFGVYQYATISSNKLFNENYTSYTQNVTRGETDINLLEKAFQDKNYNAVISQYSALDKITQKENFLVALAYIETKEYSSAITAFNAVLEKNSVSKETIFKDDAEYFLAMAYLKNNTIELAMPLFKNINNNNTHLYNDKITNGFMRSLQLINWKK